MAEERQRLLSRIEATWRGIASVRNAAVLVASIEGLPEEALMTLRLPLGYRWENGIAKEAKAGDGNDREMNQYKHEGSLPVVLKNRACSI